MSKKITVAPKARAIAKGAVAPKAIAVAAPVAPTTHVQAWRGCPALPMGATIALAHPTVCPWVHPASKKFYEVVLAKFCPCTVEFALAKAQELLGQKAYASMGQLRWLYVWGGKGTRGVQGGVYLTVNGKFYGQLPGFEFAPNAPVAKAVSKPAKARVRKAA